MTHSLFISYSRREAPFVDVLLDALEDKGVQVWLDYRSLTPGKPWLEQILAGIESAEVFLLIVSKASMASKNVELEYQHALKQQKRIVLLIFEATPLPSALQGYEWLDFRGSFNNKLRELLIRLEQPIKQGVPPQRGFKTSKTVWMTFILSLFAVAISIPGWWTLFLPALLVPLPYQILKRDFQFYRVRFALITLPIILLLSWVFFLNYQFTNIPISYCLFTSFIIAPVLLILLSSKGMRVWGKPAASTPQFSNPYIPNSQQPESVPFFIEYAIEDKKYADAIIRELARVGHLQVEDVGKSSVSFAIISRYKNTTSINPEKHTLYPIIIQDTKIEDENLLRIQWIDFRRGLRNLNNFARLLSNPAKLLKALGTAPISQQIIYPRIIQVTDYYLTLLGFFSLSIWIPLWLEFGKQFLELKNLVVFLIVNAILLSLILRTVFSVRQAMVKRTGKHASIGRLIASVIWAGVLGLAQTTYLINVIISFTAVDPILQNDLRGSAILFLPLSFGLGLILITLFGIWNWRDLTRWFPYKGTH